MGQKMWVPSELVLDKYITGDASPEEIEIVQQWCAKTTDTVEELHRRKYQADAAFAPVQTFDVLTQNVTMRTDTRLKRVTGVKFFSELRGSIAILFLIVISGMIWYFVISKRAGNWNVKGTDSVYCFVKREMKVYQIHDTGVISGGDTIQLYYKANNHHFVMALYSEGSSVYKPCIPVDTALFIPNSTQKMSFPFSVVADSSDKPLEIAVISSEKQFTVSQGIALSSQACKSNAAITRFIMLRNPR